MHPDPITDTEIEAYLDGELELRRRLAVETHLAQSPQAAARFMADLQLRTSLRLLAADLADPPPEMVEAADKLSARLNDRPARGLRLILGGRITRSLVAAALLGVIVIPARNVMASPPNYVGDAVEAYHTGLLRARMVSQVETPRFDAGEIRRSTRIRVPRLPAKWIVTDAQIFPSKEGPALQLMIRTPSAKNISIFAVRASTEAPKEPTAVRHQGATVAYWREGDMSYALTGADEPEQLDMAAENLMAEDDSSI